jgi:DNA-binding MarR family transcriptional regulator
MNDTIQGNNINWTFLTNHAHVLLCLAQIPEMRMREIADKVGITERAVQHIIADLVQAGYIDRKKEGRCNVYSIHQGKKLRHSIEEHRTIASLIEFIKDYSESDSE